MLALPFPLGFGLLLVCLLFLLHAIALAFLFFLQDAVLAHLDSLPSHDFVIQTDGYIPSRFSKKYHGILANCSMCDAEASFFFSAGLMCSCYFPQACAILQALYWSRQHQQFRRLSSIRLSLCSCYNFLPSILPSFYILSYIR